MKFWRKKELLFLRGDYVTIRNRYKSVYPELHGKELKVQGYRLGGVDVAFDGGSKIIDQKYLKIVVPECDIELTI